MFVGLQIENPNQINNLQDFFEKVEYKGVGKGLLSHLEESQTDKGETLDFVHIQDEAIPLSDLSILEDISDTLKSARLPQPLGNQINTAIGDIIKDKVRVLIIDPTKQADFTTALTGIDNLHTIAKKTQDFLANDDALKKKNIWEKLTITNQEIKTTLVAG
ncbi:MAG: hypothetical protein LBD11_03685 [Candidatus Peribacteria bacterium]|nr:hypothetical protein [Candidatus Peribacteria bacterium]